MLTKADFTHKMTLQEERPRRMARRMAELMEFANGR